MSWTCCGVNLRTLFLLWRQICIVKLIAKKCLASQNYFIMRHFAWGILFWMVDPTIMSWTCCDVNFITLFSFCSISLKLGTLLKQVQLCTIRHWCFHRNNDIHKFCFNLGVIWHTWVRLSLSSVLAKIDKFVISCQILLNAVTSLKYWSSRRKYTLIIHWLY